MVLDELLGLDPSERRGRLELAVAAGDLQVDEVDTALRMVQRLDALRVMTIAASGRLPGGILPVTEHPLLALQEVTSPQTAPAGLDSAPLPVDDAEATLRLQAMDLAARRTRTGGRSSRQRRLRIAAGPRLPTSPLQVPPADDAAAVLPTENARPSIEWLRP
jgi:hypothetical protein